MLSQMFANLAWHQLMLVLACTAGKEPEGRKQSAHDSYWDLRSCRGLRRTPYTDGGEDPE